MRKKFLAALLATSLVLTVAPVIPAGTGIAAAEETAATETLTGTKWWDGKQNSKDYTLKGDGTLDLYVGYTGGLDEGAFSVELVSDETKFITTGSDINIWTAGAEGTVEGATEPMAAITKGHKYKVSITRSGNDFTIVYFDMTDNKEHCKLTAKNTNMGNDVSIHVMAQVGTFMVGTSDFEMPADTPEAPGTATTAPDATTAPSGEATGTNFANITTQPVVSYTFDSADGVELAGEANVTDGVLNLATKESNNETYAKIADLSTFDFSNGITLTADVKVTGYKSDWTPIFMLGDGVLGGEDKDVTGLYHFSQGFSSVGGSRADVADKADWFIGYFGNGITTPYTWDWYSNAANHNKWDTITVTIDAKNMVTYINGVAVQSAEADYSALVNAFKSAKNNYLGASYWAADPDFQGSLDNVGIYNTALTATDVAALASAKATDTTPGGNTDNNNTDNNNTDNNNTGTDNNNTDTSGDDEPEVTEKKSMKVSGIVAKANTKKVTGKVSVSGAKVKVKVGSAGFKAAKVNGKKFTFTTSKLKKGTKVTIKVTKSGYKAVTKNVKVK